MSFGKQDTTHPPFPKKLINQINLIDLKPFLKDDPLSRKAKNMTEFKKYVSLQDRQLQVMSMMHQQVRGDLILNLYRGKGQNSKDKPYLKV